jgi:nucleoside-diphosphate-sugar epimerase
MTILVLGSSGQIGKPTCEYLTKCGHNVIEYDIGEDVKYDLRSCSPILLDAMNSCDFVYYLASDVGGAKYLEENEHTHRFISDNMKIMVNTFEVLKKTSKPFIFTSSQMSDMHHSSYGILKQLGEKMTNDIGGLVVRLWNVYGLEKFCDKSHVISDFCKMAKYDGVIRMRTDGMESRQLLYVDDCAECLLTLTTQYDSLDKTKNYHITNFIWNTVLDIAKHLSDISGCDIITGSRKDLTQMNAMNNPDPYILNFWIPRTTLCSGIYKIYNQL